METNGSVISTKVRLYCVVPYANLLMLKLACSKLNQLNKTKSKQL